MAEHFITVGEDGPLGAGRLFKNESLQTLDELSAAGGDPNRSVAERRGANDAFDKFSIFLDRQDRQQAARQAGRHQAEAQELELQEKRDEAAFRKEALNDPVTKRARNAFRRASLILGGPKNVPAKTRQGIVSPSAAPQTIPPSILNAVNLPPEEFDAIVREEMAKGYRPTSKQFTAPFNANRKNATEGRLQEGLDLRQSKDVDAQRRQKQQSNLAIEKEARLSVTAELNAAFKSVKGAEGFDTLRDKAIERLSKPRLGEDDIEFYQLAFPDDPQAQTDKAREDGFFVPDK